MNYIIRQETEKDFSEIYNLIKEAFKTADVKDGDEQDYAVDLRNSKKYIPQLALVAQTNDKLIGHIMLTETSIQQADNKIITVLLLSPVSVLLQYRNMGVGKALIKESCRRAKEMGYKTVFLVGNPEYYKKSGFVESSIYNIKPKDNIPAKYVQVLELYPGSLKNIEGIIECC